MRATLLGRQATTRKGAPWSWAAPTVGALAWLPEPGLLGTLGDILILDMGGGRASHLSRG